MNIYKYFIILFAVTSSISISAISYVCKEGEHKFNEYTEGIELIRNVFHEKMKPSMLGINMPYMIDGLTLDSAYLVVGDPGNPELKISLRFAITNVDNKKINRVNISAFKKQVPITIIAYYSNGCDISILMQDFRT